MAVKMLRAEIARNHFSEVLDGVLAGDEYLIDRNKRQIAAIVPAGLWEMMKKRHLAELDEQSRLIDEGHGLSLDEVEASLRKRGLIDRT